MKTKIIQGANLLAVGVALALAACGGGGGGGGSGGGTASVPVTPAPVTPVTDANAQVPLAPAPTYLAASGNAAVYTEVNTVRSSIGSGQLTQNAPLDAAALAHWNYINTDDGSLLKSHTETAGVAGFTGVDPTARALAAGYRGVVAESMFGQNLAADAWGSCADAWANSVYHVAVLFSNARDIGMAAGTTKAYPAYGKYTVCVLEVGVATGAAEQLPPEGTVRVYPYAGQTGVPLVFFNHTESPTPLPAFAELGAPISLNFKAKPATTAPAIIISVLNVAPTAGGGALDVRILVNNMASNGPAVTPDSNQDIYTATLVPTARLTASTSYTVTFAGTVNGKAAAKSWSFTTAAN
ncbi:Ig-like domain-containing protein [Massilia sp. PWRC2]|uniref:Ig-like domain-containing protein n=1 Tax=Massilia sp. PWRC2 TaxID=2804626 RepID=UPI003CEB9A94